jgi:hypothetical protein
VEEGDDGEARWAFELNAKKNKNIFRRSIQMPTRIFLSFHNKHQKIFFLDCTFVTRLK